jgi:vacuolar-type H+-ATPase subunit E/Vma4
MRIKVLAAREAAIQEIVAEAKTKLREVSKNPTTYKKLLTDLLVQVRGTAGKPMSPMSLMGWKMAKLFRLMLFA